MERHFGLPIAFAAAAHAALLFGFSKPPVTAVHSTPPTKTGDDVFIAQEVDLVPPETTESAGPASRELPDAPPVTQPDAPSVDTMPTFVQPIAPTLPFDPTSVARIVPRSAGIHGIEGGTGIADVLPSGLLDNSPRTRFQAAPLYPFEAKREGRSGEVMVEFMVDESGRVHDPRVVTSSDRVFEEAAVRAVAKWQFEPGRRDGKIVRFRMSVPIVFRLSE